SVAMRYSEFSPADGLDGAGAGRPLSSSLSSFDAGRVIAAGVPLDRSSLSLLRDAGMADSFELCDEMLSDRPELDDPPRRRPPAAAPPSRRGARAAIHAVPRDVDRAHLGLCRLIENKALALRVDAVDQPVLVAAGVDLSIGTDRHAEDVFLLRRVEDARLALGRQALDPSLRPRAGVKILSLRIDGKRPDIAAEAVVDHLRLSIRANADHTAARPGAGIDGPVRRQRQAEHLWIVAGVDDRHFTVGGNLEDLAAIAGRCVEVPLLVLDDIPDVGGFEAGKRLQLFGEPQGALVTDDGAVQPGLVKVSGPLLVPDLYLGGAHG